MGDNMLALGWSMEMSYLHANCFVVSRKSYHFCLLNSYASLFFIYEMTASASKETQVLCSQIEGSQTSNSGDVYTSLKM